MFDHLVRSLQFVVKASTSCCVQRAERRRIIQIELHTDKFNAFTYLSKDEFFRNLERLPNFPRRTIVNPNRLQMSDSYNSLEVLSYRRLENILI